MKKNLRSEKLVFDCTGVELRLSDYLDDLLDEQSHKVFVQHCQSCPKCQSLVSEFTAIQTAARSLADTPLPSGVRQRLHARLARERNGNSKRVEPQLRVVK